MDEVYWAVFTRGENAMPELLGSERVDKPEMVSELLQEQDEMPVIGSGLAYVDRMDAISRWPMRDGFTPTCSSSNSEPGVIAAATRKNVAEEMSLGTSIFVAFSRCPPSKQTRLPSLDRSKG